MADNANTLIYLLHEIDCYDGPHPHVSSDILTFFSCLPTPPVPKLTSQFFTAKRRMLKYETTENWYHIISYSTVYPNPITLCAPVIRHVCRRTQRRQQCGRMG